MLALISLPSSLAVFTASIVVVVVFAADVPSDWFQVVLECEAPHLLALL
jgi:hypothetical protein